MWIGPISTKYSNWWTIRHFLLFFLRSKWHEVVGLPPINSIWTHTYVLLVTFLYFSFFSSFPPFFFISMYDWKEQKKNIKTFYHSIGLTHKCWLNWPDFGLSMTVSFINLNALSLFVYPYVCLAGCVSVFIRYYCVRMLRFDSSYCLRLKLF